jgi:peptidyl-dipeptidase A
MKKLFVILALALLLGSCTDQQQAEQLLQHFLNRHEFRIKPIIIRYNKALWNALSGKTSFTDLLNESRLMDSLYLAKGEHTEYYQNLLNNVYGNRSEFEILQKIKKSGLIGDSLLKRQFIKVYQEYVSISNNTDKSKAQMTDLFNQFYDLKRKEVAFWDSIKKVGAPDAQKQWIDKFTVLVDDYRDLIKLLNQDAVSQGFKNYNDMSLTFNGINTSELEIFIDKIDKGTKNDFDLLMKQVKEEIINKYHIEAQQIEPYQINQEFARFLLPSEKDTTYSKNDFMGILETFFGYGNLPIDAIYANSDIWFEEGKINQSFFFSPDSEKKDYRIYSNSKPNLLGMGNLIHEFGHAVHYQSVGPTIPYLLSEPHPITAEGVGIYFGNKLFYSKELQALLGINTPNKSVYFNQFTNPSVLVFARKLIRAIKFEKAIFENPDQDFNELWWSLSEKYLYEKVENKNRLPEWITNYHILTVSGIHVDYIYAIAFAAQLEYFHPGANFGALKDRLFFYGDAMSWDRLLELSTGEKLDLNYFFNSYRKHESKDNENKLYSSR